MTHLPDPLHQPQFYADVTGKRLLAWVLDAGFIFVLCLLILPFTGFLAVFVWPMFWLVVGFCYRVMTIANGSATWGMRIAAIELRNSEGTRLSFGEAALHTLGYSLCIASLLVQAVSIVLMCGSLRGQSLPDHVLGTVMVNKRALI